MKHKKITLGFVAPSGAIPKVEFKKNIELIASRGFEVKVHPSIYKTHLFFAGSDEERAQAFYDFAIDPEVDVVWAARGGYGAIRIMAHLEKLVRKYGLPPKKLFVGFSDSTVLLDYLFARWGWNTLHAPMPGLRTFEDLPPRFWKPLAAHLRSEIPQNPWGVKGDLLKLNWMTKAPKTAVTGQMTGGNLCVLTSLVGTPYMPTLFGKILFLEETTESLYRVDRLVEQLKLSGVLQGVKAIVLGTFDRCEDKVPTTLGGRLRPVLSPEKGLRAIFVPLGDTLKIPVARGIPSGHASLKLAGGSLPMGETTYKLTSAGMTMRL